MFAFALMALASFASPAQSDYQMADYAADVGYDVADNQEVEMNVVEYNDLADVAEISPVLILRRATPVKVSTYAKLNNAKSTANANQIRKRWLMNSACRQG